MKKWEKKKRQIRVSFLKKKPKSNNPPLRFFFIFEKTKRLKVLKSTDSVGIKRKRLFFLPQPCFPPGLLRLFLSLFLFFLPRPLWTYPYRNSEFFNLSFVSAFAFAFERRTSHWHVRTHIFCSPNCPTVACFSFFLVFPVVIYSLVGKNLPLPLLLWSLCTQQSSNITTWILKKEKEKGKKKGDERTLCVVRVCVYALWLWAR